MTAEYVNDRDAAEFLAVSVHTLRSWRIRGDGPPFRKLGWSVRYNLNELKAWAESRRRLSTSDPGPKGAR